MTGYRYRAANDEVIVVRVAKNDSNYTISLGEKQYHLSYAEITSGQLTLILDGIQLTVSVADHDSTTLIAVEGVTYRLERLDNRPRRDQMIGTSASTVEASMPGTILEILVAEQEPVKQGQPVIILEAMKMELRLTAPQSGRIEKIEVQPGELVQQGMILLTLMKD